MSPAPLSLSLIGNKVELEEVSLRSPHSSLLGSFGLYSSNNAHLFQEVGTAVKRKRWGLNPGVQKVAMKRMERALSFVLAFLPLLSRIAGAVLDSDADKRIEDANWSCICDPGGRTGVQMRNNTTSSQRSYPFTDCSCSSSCSLCPVGQVMDPRIENNKSCSCFSPLFVSVHLFNLHLSTYTLAMENAFVSKFASLLQISPNQIFPVSRWEGSVVLNIYIFPSLGTINEWDDLVPIAAYLLQSNTSHNGVLEVSEVGPFSIISVENIPPMSGYISSIAANKGKLVDGKLLFLALVFSITIAIIISVMSLLCLLNRRKKRLRQSSLLWFERDVGKSQGFTTTMISQQSSLSEDFLDCDSLCFKHSTGCMGRCYFKSNLKMNPILGQIVYRFSYIELEKATQGFLKHNIIGIGGRSNVYRGYLKGGKVVAIKRLSTAQHGPDVNREFISEVEILSRLHHCHLVPLVGYCIDTHGNDIERLLVYEFMPNGNLREHLNKPLGKDTLTWLERVMIALGAAKGLEYLHEAAEPRVLHRDFKSSNILLDENWRAKVADFGMATAVKDADYNETYPASPAQMLGTFGYFAPEYAMMGRATKKTDVFSFGVVLLELISGRQPLDKSLPKGQESLVVWALGLLQDEKRVINELPDPSLKHCFPSEGVWRISQLALACLQHDAEMRPTMVSVVQTLASIIPLPHNNTNTSSDMGLIVGVEQDKKFSVEDDENSDQQITISASPDNMIEKHRLMLIETEDGVSSSEGMQSVTIDGPSKRHLEDESLDLLRPQMETFWENNGLLVHQYQSPTR